MSKGRFSNPPLAPEDDWFFDPDRAPATEPVVPSDPPGGHEESLRAQGREGPRNRRTLLAVAVGAAILVIGGVVAALAVTGSAGNGEATTPTPPATTAPTTTTPTTPTPRTTTTDTIPTTPDPTLPEGVLRRGDESEGVSRLQAALGELGYSTGGIDGKFGPATEQAVREFQSSSGLEEDGVAGPATLAALSDALDRQ